MTSYSTLRADEASDISYPIVAADGSNLGQAITGIYGSTVPLGVTQINRTLQKKFTQEVRLASAKSTHFEWLVGGYFTREPGRISNSLLPFDVQSGRLLANPDALALAATGVPNILDASLDSVYKEYAAFASVTAHFGSRFDVTAGGRFSRNRQTSRQIFSGFFTSASDLPGRSSENVFTWSIAPRFEINKHTAIYARVAKGYRPGGPNVVPPAAPGNFPFQFNADTLISYEAGVRSETADRRFGIDASVYYLDWKNIQLANQVLVDGVGYNINANGGGAQSYGAEVSATLRPVSGFNIIGSVAYNHSKLTDDTVIGGLKGDQLPYAPHWTANLGADYEWRLSDSAKAFVGGDLRLVSKQPANFDPAFQGTFGRRSTIKGYKTIDLRAGVEFRKVDLTIYARNLTNERGLTNIGALGFRPGGAIDLSPIRPRTIGATLGFRY